MHSLLCNRKNLLRLATVSLGYLTVGAPCAALAQSTDSFETITVTARRVEENVQKVPSAVTALSAADLENYGIDSILDLKNQVPGLYVATFNTMDSLVVAIRGQRTSQVQPGQDPSIGVYINEVPTGFQVGLNLGMFDLDNIQALKGPQGTLFGRNSTGGALLINTHKPTELFQGSFRAGLEGNYRGIGFSTTGVLNVPITDELRARLAFNTVNQAGWVENIADPAIVAAAGGLAAYPEYSWPFGKTNFEDQGKTTMQEWRISLEWEPLSNLTNTLVYQGAHYHLNSWGAHLLDVVIGTSRGATYIPYMEKQRAANNFWSNQQAYNTPTWLDQHQIINTTTIDLGNNLILKNIAGWKKIERLWTSDTLGTPLGLSQTIIARYDQSGMEASEELQLSGESFDGQLNWVAGGFFFYNKFTQIGESAAFTFSNRMAPNATTMTLAAFAQGTYQVPWVEGLALTLGARYTADRRAMSKVQYNTTPTNCITNGPTGCYWFASRNFGQWTYNAAINYQIDDTKMVYASLSRGYRAGGFNISESSYTNYLLGYKPETVRNYEVGLKSEWDIGFPLRANLAGYFQDYKNIVRQAQSPLTPLFAILTNGPKAEILGGEVEVSVRPWPGMNVSLAYGYVSPRYTAPFYPFAPPITFNAQFNKFSQVPNTTVTLNTSYTFQDIPSDYGAFTIGGTFFHQSRMWYDDTQQASACGSAGNLYCGPINAYSQKPYSLIDLRLNWDSVMGSDFDIKFWVSNLLNTKYHASASPLANTLGFTTYVGKPRFWGIDLKYHLNGG